MGFLFGGRGPRSYRRPGLIGNLLGGNSYRQVNRQPGLISSLLGNPYYQQRRQGRFGGSLWGLLATGAMGYAANRWRNSRAGTNQKGGFGTSNWGDNNPANTGNGTSSGGGSFNVGGDNNQNW